MMHVGSASSAVMQHMPWGLWMLFWYQMLGPSPAVWFLQIQYAQRVVAVGTANQLIAVRVVGWEMIWLEPNLWRDQSDSSWCEAPRSVQSVSQLLWYQYHSECAWHDQLPRNLHYVVVNLDGWIQSDTLTGGPGEEREVSWIEVME